MNSICLKSAVWDLHIHSNRCTKPDKDLAKLSTKEYIDQLLSLLANYPALEMISFTDHNSISEDVYREFDIRDTNIVLLPGIEIDMKLTDDGESKHLVVYFNLAPQDEEFPAFCEKINSFIRDRDISDKNPILISTLLDYLIDLKIEFAISPHAMKQKTRAITWDWSIDGEDDPNIEKYIDQFFVLWETSGYSQVAYAIEYLKKINAEEKESIVAFSDSKDFKKLKSYLDSPDQYFSALPSFTGLKMVGSEVRRITRNMCGVKQEDSGKYIGQIKLGESVIQLSPKMNVVIGGRGSGKSILLDRLAACLDYQKCSATLDDSDRMAFVSSESLEAYSLSGQKIEGRAFGFEFFNQSYITELFRNKGEEFNKQLQGYFSAAFGAIKEIETETIKSTNAARFAELINDETVSASNNLINFVGRYEKDHDEKLSIKIPKGPKKAETKDAESLSYSDLCGKIDKAFKKDIPEIVRTAPKVQEALDQYKKTVLEAACKERSSFLDNGFIKRSLYERFTEKKKELNEAQKDKAAAIDEFIKIFRNAASDAVKRTRIIRAYLIAEAEFVRHYEESGYANGENQDSFKFLKELTITSPIDYLIECFNAFLKTKTGNNEKCDRSNLMVYIDSFRFNTAAYKSEKTALDLENALIAYNLSYIEKSSVWFRKNEKCSYQDISNMSPGTRTNILLEYIVHRDTNYPLLIDQPEDNVDNQTIFGQIKDWFITLKNKRQVIVVTHDANIVINADAENVILASQMQDGSFGYRYGALEYDNILDEASIILDGGVEAVKRRLMKYGG